MSSTAIPPGGRPRTIVVNPSGAPSNSLSFSLPKGVSIDLESVLAEIDATGAGATRATLTVADSSGAVIARKRQGEAIPAGGTGSATWALRLADERGSGGGGGIEFDTDNQGGYLDVTANNQDGVGAGINMQDASGGFTRIQNNNSRLDLERPANTAILISQTATLEGINGAQVLAAGNNSVVVITAGRGTGAAVGGAITLRVEGVNGGLFLNNIGGVAFLTINAPRLGFYGAGGVAKPNVVGAKGGNVALGNLLTALANLGLITNSTTP